MKTIHELKQMSIVDYLQQAGYEPARNKGNAYWYCSPLRLERSPSFKVNIERNQWYDFGSGEYGDIIDLVCALHRCQTAEAIRLLDGFMPAPSKHFSLGGNQANTKFALEVVEVLPLRHPKLRQYLASRYVDLTLAESYCSEVHYRHGERSYFAIGFPNDMGGWELRNPDFKGCIAPKALSSLRQGAETIQVFEGFVDFLSWRTLYPEEASDSIVLNSLALLPRVIPQLAIYSAVECFLDNDEAGRRALQTIREACIDAKDRSDIYSSYKDLNEWLCLESKSQKQAQMPRKRGFRR